MSVGCFIVISPYNWKHHASGPFLATTAPLGVPLDVADLLGNEGSISTFTVRWDDGVGIEFHTLVGSPWNQATRQVMEELGIEVPEQEDDDDDDDTDNVVCTIVTCPRKQPLTRPMYDWFSTACQKSLY